MVEFGEVDVGERGSLAGQGSERCLPQGRADSVVDWDLIVIGAGAAGLLAASRAAELGLRTILLEKNRKPGVKILMSGGTRCNLTHHTDVQGIVRAFGKQGRFLHSALAMLGPTELVQLFEKEGLPTKVEATGKVFPASDKALHVQQTLLKRLERTGGQLRTACPVNGIEWLGKGAGFRIQLEAGELTCENLIVAVGGQSYPGCGTTGDGYAWLRELGHAIVAPHPALTPLQSNVEWVRELSGVTIGDVELGVIAEADSHRAAELGRKKLQHLLLAHSRTSFLFTHSGFSGPGPMNVSRAVTHPGNAGPFRLICDFVPATDDEFVRDDLGRFCREEGSKRISHWLNRHIPRRLADAVDQAVGIDRERPAAELTKRSRESLFQFLKRCPIPLHGTLGYAKAEVTAGGVSLDEVHSQTMESKLVPGLYLVGEILDVDGPIGGYNFQAAFATGWLAATRLAERRHTT